MVRLCQGTRELVLSEIFTSMRCHGIGTAWLLHAGLGDGSVLAEFFEGVPVPAPSSKVRAAARVRTLPCFFRLNAFTDSSSAVVTCLRTCVRHCMYASRRKVNAG